MLKIFLFLYFSWNYRMQKFPSYLKVFSKKIVSLTVVSKRESNEEPDVSTVQPQGSFDSNC